MANNIHKFLLRIDPSLFKFIEKLASKNRRSVTQEMNIIFEERRKQEKKRSEFSNT